MPDIQMKPLTRNVNRITHSLGFMMTDTKGEPDAHLYQYLCHKCERPLGQRLNKVDAGMPVKCECGALNETP